MIIGFVLLKSGQYLPKMSQRESDKMFFVGDVNNPLAIGKKGEIMKLLDADFFALLELYRWFKSGMLNVDMRTDAAYVTMGIRAFSEVDK